MKKRISITFNLSDKLYYTFIAIGIFIILGVGVYAVAGVSHSIDEIPSIPWSKLIDIPSGLSDGDNDSVCPEGYDLVEGIGFSRCLRDFSQVGCSTINVYTFVGTANIRRVNGVIQTRANLTWWNGNCDSGWVNGNVAECIANGIPVKAEFNGASLNGYYNGEKSCTLGI